MRPLRTARKSGKIIAEQKKEAGGNESRQKGPAYGASGKSEESWGKFSEILALLRDGSSWGHLHDYI